MSYKKRFIIGLFFIDFVLLLYFFGNETFFTLTQLQEYKNYVQQFVAQRYIFSVLFYLVFFITASIFGIPITVLLTIAAGYFFGPIIGVLYANIGATIGSLISFLIYRYLLSSWVRQRYSKQLQLFDQNIEHYGHNYLLMLQLLPITPTLLINVFAGVTKLPLWTFLWTTSLGILPGSLLYTFAGQQLMYMKSVEDVLSWPMLLLLTLFALLAVFPVFLKRSVS